MTVPFLPLDGGDDRIPSGYFPVATDEKKKTEYVWSLTTPARYMLIKEHPFCRAAFSSTLVIGQFRILMVGLDLA